ncbi:hypothetical protein CDV31_000562 [Fusarium ambrosium]|uniref:Uncharacterized protein n=1 Tax=Fusarium ambrosium TaxID=131363 RepID=A0A428V207_9HYPO|nr:hypothetical protein CDV31_000562 [Fusarium ambrosium]
MNKCFHEEVERRVFFDAGEEEEEEAGWTKADKQQDNSHKDGRRLTEHEVRWITLRQISITLKDPPVPLHPCHSRQIKGPLSPIFSLLLSIGYPDEEQSR